MINRGVYSATCSILREDYSLNVEATIVDFVETFYKHYKYRIPLYSIVELGNMIEDVNNILPKLRL